MKTHEKYINEDYASSEYQTMYKEISTLIGNLQRAMGKHQKNFKKASEEDRLEFVGDLRLTQQILTHIPTQIHILERRK